jgi:ribonuclease E
MKENTAAIHVQVPVDVGTYLLNEKRTDVQAVELRHKVTILLIPNIHLETPQHTVLRVRHDATGQDELQQASYRMVALPTADDGKRRGGRGRFPGTPRRSGDQGNHPSAACTAGRRASSNPGRQRQTGYGGEPLPEADRFLVPPQGGTRGRGRTRVVEGSRAAPGRDRNGARRPPKRWQHVARRAPRRQSRAWRHPGQSGAEGIATSESRRKPEAARSPGSPVRHARVAPAAMPAAAREPRRQRNERRPPASDNAGHQRPGTARSRRDDAGSGPGSGAERG